MPLSKRKLGIYLFLYVILLGWLTSVWYTHFIPFHFFNDFFEWLYLDKLGHFFSSFHLSLYFYQQFGKSESLDSSQPKKWICWSGFFLLLPIEILDGFSPNYGASPADLLANGLGSLFCYLHVSYRVASGLLPKFSFHTTAFHLIRPDLLGYSLPQQVLKDYNGQTYWVAVDINKIFHKKILPEWLVVSVGYGAEGLLGGHDNVWQSAAGNPVSYSHIARTKRFFISVDIIATTLMGKNKIFNYLFSPFLFLKFPAPAIELNMERGWIFHPVYF